MCTSTSGLHGSSIWSTSVVTHMWTVLGHIQVTLVQVRDLISPSFGLVSHVGLMEGFVDNNKLKICSFAGLCYCVPQDLLPTDPLCQRYSSRRRVLPPLWNT